MKEEVKNTIKEWLKKKLYIKEEVKNTIKEGLKKKQLITTTDLIKETLKAALYGGLFGASCGWAAKKLFIDDSNDTTTFVDDYPMLTGAIGAVVGGATRFNDVRNTQRIQSEQPILHFIKTNNNEYVLPLDGELISKNDTKEELQEKNRCFICIDLDDPNVIFRNCNCCISIFGDNYYAKRLKELMFGKNTKSNTITEHNEFVVDFCYALADIAKTYIYTMYQYHLSINRSITDLNKCKKKEEIIPKTKELLQKILYTIQFVKDYPDDYKKFNDMINKMMQDVQNNKRINVHELSSGIQSFGMNLQKKSDDIKDSLIKYLKGVKYTPEEEKKIIETQDMFIDPKDIFISQRMKEEIKKQKNKRNQQKQIKNDANSLFGGVKKVVSDKCNIF